MLWLLRTYVYINTYSCLTPNLVSIYVSFTTEYYTLVTGDKWQVTHEKWYVKRFSISYMRDFSSLVPQKKSFLALNETFQILLVLISNLAPTFFFFLVFELGLVPTQICLWCRFWIWWLLATMLFFGTNFSKHRPSAPMD